MQYILLFEAYIITYSSYISSNKQAIAICLAYRTNSARMLI